MGETGGSDRENSVLESLISPMLSGFDREQENSAIVSALAHVVAAGDQGDANGESGSSPSACSFWVVGEKRGRQEQEPHDHLGLSESVLPAVCRAYSDLPLVGSSRPGSVSSSSTTSISSYSSSQLMVSDSSNTLFSVVSSSTDQPIVHTQRLHHHMQNNTNISASFLNYPSAQMTSFINNPSQSFPRQLPASLLDQMVLSSSSMDSTLQPSSSSPSLGYTVSSSPSPQNPSYPLFLHIQQQITKPTNAAEFSTNSWSDSGHHQSSS
ncbi:hypothetical protein ACH5RR_012572 [Cinchona calisaya]|uniref:Uncharacterized protein n=1 Tax=Cinchona calisaya TaxID=153742 RepID=A0ABD3A832_9GENT